MKFAKFILGGCMLLFLTACPPPPCECQFIDLGSLSEEDLARSPYVDGEAYLFRHSKGQEIVYTAERSQELHTDFWDCMEIKRESDLTTLNPDYPVFPLRVSTHMEDSAFAVTYIRIGNTSYTLPADPENLYGNSYYDSIQLGEKRYHEVYLLVNPPEGGGKIAPCKLYYNFTYGILVFILNNGEYYERIP